jgi:hypothetical protein
VGAALTRREAIAAVAALRLMPTARAAGETSRWQAHFDSLKNAESHAAAEYVASQFAQAGLRPAGGNGSFLQPVSFIAKQLDERASSLALRTAAGVTEVRLGEDAAIDTSVDPASAFDSELVFVGYGLRIPEIHHDDFKGLEMKGRVAVYLDGAPVAARGEMAAYYGVAAVRWSAMKAAGIAGMISIGREGERLPENGTTLQLTDLEMNDMAGARIRVRWNAAAAGMLFTGSGHEFRDLAAAAAAGKALPRFPIDARLQAKTVVKRSPARGTNVVGNYPGISKEKELVVVSCALADRAGMASLMEAARRLGERKVKTARSLLFFAAAGDETGQPGTAYFLARSSAAKSAVAAIGLPAAGEFERSAAWEFILRRVPGAMVETESGDASEEVMRAASRVANENELPRWKPDSLFRRFAR